jgi:ATP-dependent RNA helicase RhlE
LLRAVAEQGYTQPTPIQIQSIPLVLEGRDLMAGAQTGTGKTAGFALPLMQRLGEPQTSAPRALILAPTRELAAQVEESFRVYGKYLRLRSCAIFGGVSMVPQVKALRAGVDILVATPGRLLDHVQQRTIDLSKIEILVLDEADRMLDLGFIRDIRRILALLPAQRQNLLFSATFSDEVQELAAAFMHSPAMIQAATRNAPSDLVAQVVHPVDSGRKRELLAHLITAGNWQQVLVFTRTKHGANRLAQQLVRDGIEADAIHGNKSQSRRTRSLADFKRGALRVLVATDIAARGLDIEELPHVVNFDLPHVPEDYVHRIGRTGRAGSTGEAVSLLSGEDQSLIGGIERLLKRRLERKVIEGFEAGRPGAPDKAEPPDRPQRAAHRRNPSNGGQRPAGQERPRQGQGRRAGPDGRQGPARGQGEGRARSQAPRDGQRRREEPAQGSPGNDERGNRVPRNTRDEAAERWAKDPASKMTMHQIKTRKPETPQRPQRGRGRAVPALLGGTSRNSR